MKLTHEMLIAKGAEVGCRELVIAKAEWPDGVDVTLEVCLRAAELQLWFDWGAVYLLSPAAQKIYDAERAAALTNYDAERARAFYAAWQHDHPTAAEAKEERNECTHI